MQLPVEKRWTCGICTGLSKVHAAMASEWAKLSITETGDTYSKEEKWSQRRQ